MPGFFAQRRGAEIYLNNAARRLCIKLYKIQMDGGHKAFYPPLKTGPVGAVLPLKNAFWADLRHIPPREPWKRKHKYVNLTYCMTSYGHMVMILLCRDFLSDRPQPAVVGELQGNGG